MSSCICGTDSDKKRSLLIDRKLRSEAKKLKRQVNVLLLGSGESGKSTFLKQMILMTREFNDGEVREYRRQIYQNVVAGMRTLLDARERFEIPWRTTNEEQRAALELAASKIKSFTSAATRDLDCCEMGRIVPVIETIWNDESVQICYEQRNLFQLADSVKYFFESIRRIGQPDFRPTNRDILLCRKATRTMSEHLLHIENVPFMFIDVGGQRSQRQKWFQYFDGVTSILFLAASNEYDQHLLEDRRKNRLSESIDLFEAIINNAFFEHIAIILFLNKTDLLTEKVHRSDIRMYFPGFTGDCRKLTDVQQYIVTRFESTRRNQKRRLYHHFTTAVDTDNIRKVFKACKEIILDRNLESLGMQ